MKKGINQTDLLYLLGLIKDRFYTKDEADLMFLKLSNGVTITLSGSNCTLSNSNIRYRRSFTTNVIRDFGYTVTGILVTMGGVDITSTSVSNNTVTIPKVLDNVIITATTSLILTSNLTGVLYSNFDLDIGLSWSTSLVAESGKTLLPNTVKVMMGSVDITEGSFNFELGSIEINNVTDALEISAKSIIMPEGYTPIQYIRNTNLVYNSTKYRYFDTGYHPTNLTVVEHDFNFLALSNNGGLMGAGGYEGTPFFAVGCSYGDLERGRIAWGNVEYTTADFTVARNLRQTLTFGKGTLTCKNISNVTQTKTIASTLATPWTSSKTFTIGGFQHSANVYRVGPLKLYGCKIYEDTQLQLDWVPFVRNSDNYVGFYDIKNDTFVTEKTTTNTDRCDWIRPYVGVARTLTNCTQLMLTGLLASGNASMAIIGETWSSRFTPAANYTFENGTFQIMIEGIDKTDEYATYDIETDTWTVSFIPHWTSTNIVTITATPIAYTLRYVLKDVQLSNTTPPELGESYTTTISSSTNEKQLLPSTVRVYMSKVNITNDVYNPETNTITIPEVTGGIDIYGESGVVDSTYEPLYVVRTKSRSTAANTNGFFIPYYPNNNTKLVADININQNAGYTVLYAIWNPNTAPSSNSPQFNFWIRVTTLTNYIIMFGAASTNTATNTDGLFKFGYRNLYTCDKGIITYTNNDGNIYTRILNGGIWSYTAGLLRFFTEGPAATSTYPCNGEIYRVTISEDDNKLFDYIPVKRISDEKLYLYNLVDSSVLALPSNYISTYNKLIRTIANCTQTFLSASDTGNAAYAVINKTWSCKYTPANGSTFTHPDSTFKVIVNGVDQTNVLGTYDSTEDSWTVTLVANFSDKIEIIAKLITYDAKVEYIQSDGTAYINLPMSVKNGDYLCVELDMENLTTTTNINLLNANSTNQFRANTYSYTSSTNVTVFGSSIGADSNKGGISITNGQRSTFLLSTLKAGPKDLVRPIKSDFTSMTLLSSGMLVKIYGMTVDHKTNQIYNLIPVRKGSVGYLYDTISGQLYGNAASSGSFTYGNDV